MSTSLFYTERIPRSIRAAQVAGITATTLFAGFTVTQSFILVPALLEAPAPLLARQWKKVVSLLRGTVIPVSCLAPAVVFGYLGYREPPRSTSFKYYIASALLLSSALPYTTAILAPVTQKIHNRAEALAVSEDAELGVREEETVHAMVDKWATLNLGRSALVLAASLSAIWASLNSVEVVGLGLRDLRLGGGANRLG